MKWEDIGDGFCRAKVFGGWLVSHTEWAYHAMPDGGMNHGWDTRVALTFVPDPNHEWEVNQEEKTT